ncbi:MAG: FtsX-like permease family protein [Thermincola sp.]|jgi:ABC-type antimicrobial peptide transport system permease subunit|nr:FtsX-like permease family protein [Thermincola sp.]
MKSYLSLAFKELKSQKLMTILIIIAIIMSTAMTTVIGQSITTMKKMMPEQARFLNGDRYVTFHQLDGQQVEKLKSQEGLLQVGKVKTVGSTKIKVTGISLFVREYDETSLKNYPNIAKVQSGRLPRAAHEIAMDENTLKILGITPGIGDKITLDLNASLLNDSEQPFSYSAEFILTGILESDYAGYSSGIITAIAGQGTAAALLPDKYNLTSVDFKLNDLSNFQSKIDQLTAELNLQEDQIQYNWVYLDALGADYREKNSETDGAVGMAVAAIYIGVLILMAAGLVIYNILKISIVKKIKEYGCLRAIGAEPGQLYKIVITQILLLCAVAIPIGSAIGILSANTITAAATSLINPEVFLADNSEQLTNLIHSGAKAYLIPLMLSVGISLLFSFVAALPSAVYAAKVSPKVAMAGAFNAIKRKGGKSRTIHNFERHLAWLNLRRNIGRTIITILSLFMSITVFVALSAFSSTLDVSQSVSDLKMGDFSISSESAGISKTAVDNLYENNNVKRVSFAKYAMYTQKQIEQGELQTDIAFENPSEALKIIGIDEQYLKEVYPEISSSQLADFKNGKLCIVRNPITVSSEYKAANLQEGDTFHIGNKELTVQAITNKTISIQGTGWTNGIDVIVYDTVYDELTGKNAINQMNVYAKDKSGLEVVQAAVEAIHSANPGSRFLSYVEYDRQLEESFAQTKTLAWGFILFIALIGVLNIINTTYTNIHTRVNEIGMQRAIGMDNRSLYKIFLWEGAYYGILAAVFGSFAGYMISVLMNAAATGELDLSNFPLIPVLSASCLSIAACLIATVIPLGKIKRMSIVESIDTVE